MPDPDPRPGPAPPVPPPHPPPYPRPRRRSLNPLAALAVVAVAFAGAACDGWNSVDRSNPLTEPPEGLFEMGTDFEPVDWGGRNPAAGLSDLTARLILWCREPFDLGDGEAFVPEVNVQIELAGSDRDSIERLILGPEDERADTDTKEVSVGFRFDDDPVDWIVFSSYQAGDGLLSYLGTPTKEQKASIDWMVRQEMRDWDDTSLYSEQESWKAREDIRTRNTADLVARIGGSGEIVGAHRGAAFVWNTRGGDAVVADLTERCSVPPPPEVSLPEPRETGDWNGWESKKRGFVMATLSSTTSMNSAELRARCLNSRTELWIDWEEFIPTSWPYEMPTVSVRLDDGEAEVARWNGSTESLNTQTWAPRPVGLLRRMMKAESMRVTVSHGLGVHGASFDLRHGGEEVRHIADACDWTLDR